MEPSPWRLDDAVAIVTGAARGIGRAIALDLARGGARLALCDRDAELLAEATEAMRAEAPSVDASVLDVRDASSVASFVAAVAKRHGRIDVLVNNAGGTFEAAFLELSANAQRALVDENFSSVTHCIRAVVPHVPEAGGAIVNLSSVEAHRAAPGYAVYAAMKAAVESLTRSLALELAPRGIRVNAVAADAIPTPGTGGAAAPTPLPWPGTPEDVAGAVLFLASPLSRFVTGTTLHVDGGTRAAGGWRRDGDGGYEL